MPVSTRSITAPARLPNELGKLDRGRLRAIAGRLIRGREADPPWSRPLLWLVALVAGLLAFWGLTRNGYANSYYAEAAQAASHSWKAWITNALDTSGSDSLDKGPLANMLMGLSGRMLGFSSFSMLLPEALCGIGSVLLLHNLVKRTLGHPAALLAALMLALTPIFVAMSRFNNHDAVLVLTEVAAAWALVRALQSGRTRYVLLCGAFVGLAFNVKMLEAYLIVPGLVLAYLLAGQGRLRRRLCQLTAGGAVMFAVSFAWYGAMMLLPASARPWVGDTTDNSWFTLIFEGNGLNRVSGSEGGPAGGFGGASGPLRMFNTIVGGQIAWLIPLAAAGLALGLWTYRRSARTDLRRSAYVLWGGWALVSWAVFSFANGIFHPYYTSMLAPAVAVLASAGVIVLWDRSRASVAWTAALVVAVCATAAVAVLLLTRTSGFVPWLVPAIVVCAALAGAALLLSAVMSAPGRAPLVQRLTRFAVIAGVLAVLAGPASYSIATVGKSLTGANPLAGPASVNSGVGGGPPGGPGGGAQRAGRPTPPNFLGGTPPGGPPPAGAFGRGAGRRGIPGGLGGVTVDKVLVKYLVAHQGNATYLTAAVGYGTSASIALQSGKNVINMGGFTGSDPAPSLSKLKQLVASGQLHYVLLSNAQRGRMAGPGGPNAAVTARDAWVKGHGTVVTISGQPSGAGTLYYLASNS
jgi:4-amino-4-deoxy-L-arabinose transferase-like glycosyltransferase